MKNICLLFIMNTLLGLLYKDDVIVNTNQSISISTFENLQEKTLSGNLDATNEYLDYLQLNTECITSEILEWEQIASENELVTLSNSRTNIHMYNYALTLIDIEKNEARAVFWILRSNVDYKSDPTCNRIMEKYKSIINYNSSDLLPEKMDELENLAKIGSKEAAENLYLYFSKTNTMESDYWLRIGAQNGSKTCMQEYSNILRNKSDKYDVIRADFWITLMNE